ncbi:hypothetical protein VB773_18730 [Haloarculaceae archaeon H-GB2-1]|nr:hypothetical protein [Haloarculaceae archaeon H-GB1-1]MEA5387910.1 hypothetical protein [Haloarculaceae archaeon H-GB11]MEA5409405.1 hypothetical protein [Haloarculaceae archaeon H-GB2-1]
MQATNTSFQPTIPYLLRKVIGPWLTLLARAVGQPEYRLYHSEYVGTVEMPLDEFISTLQEGGFRWGPVSWYHQPPVGSDPDGSWTYRPTPLSDRQLHVVLCVNAPERIDVYAHEEYNWMRHPVKHARQVGIERERGASELQRWLEKEGIDHDYDARVTRRAMRLIHWVRTDVRERLGRT